MTAKNEIRKKAGLKTRGGNIVSLDEHVMRTAKTIKENLKSCPDSDSDRYAKRALIYLNELIKTACKSNEKIKERKKNVLELRKKLFLENWKLPYKEMLKTSNLFGEDLE